MVKVMLPFMVDVQPVGLVATTVYTPAADWPVKVKIPPLLVWPVPTTRAPKYHTSYAFPDSEPVVTKSALALPWQKVVVAQEIV